MRVWTFQPIGTYLRLKNGESYRTDESLIDSGFAEAYKWIASQMEHKIGPKPDGVVFPIWAWFAYEGRNIKPDRRKHLFNCYKDCEMLELEVPESELVLSDYDSWHYVLNDIWFDDSTTAEEWNAAQAWYDTLDSAKQKELKISSWEKVFDTSLINTYWEKQGFFIQATFWEIKPEYLISYKSL